MVVGVEDEVVLLEASALPVAGLIWQGPVLTGGSSVIPVVRRGTCPIHAVRETSKR